MSGVALVFPDETSLLESLHDPFFLVVKKTKTFAVMEINLHCAKAVSHISAHFSAAFVLSLSAFRRFIKMDRLFSPLILNVETLPTYVRFSFLAKT